MRTGTMHGTQAVDPICRMTVDTRSAAGVSERDGQKYYFCSPGCKVKFDAEPQGVAEKQFQSGCCSTKEAEAVSPPQTGCGGGSETGKGMEEAWAWCGRDTR